LQYAIVIIGAYLLGSVPFGVIIARLHGKDLRRIGSGNIGATNLARACGRRWAYFGFALDVAKGLVPMLVARAVLGEIPSAGELFIWLGTGCAAVAGHIFPVYLKFRGGKGVATSFGVALGLWPYYTICALLAMLVWVAVVLVWRYVSLASIIASAVFPIALASVIAITPGWEFRLLWPLLPLATGIPILVILRHRENIKRLFLGTENKISGKKN